MSSYQIGAKTIQIVDYPNTTLTRDDKEALMAPCIEVARAAFENEGVTEKDIVSHVFAVSVVIFVRDQKGRLESFASTVVETLGESRIVYLKGVAVSPHVKGAGISSLATALRILHVTKERDTENWFMSTRTQSPIVYRNYIKNFDLYPRPRPGECTPGNIKALADRLAPLVQEKHSDEQPKDGLRFDRDRLIMRGTYLLTDPATGVQRGFSMYGDHIPWCDVDDEVNGFFKHNLDLAGGDAVLILGRLDREKAKAYLIRSVTKMDPHHRPLLDDYA